MFCIGLSVSGRTKKQNIFHSAHIGERIFVLEILISLYIIREAENQKGKIKIINKVFSE